MSINDMDFTDKADIARPNNTKNKHHAPNIKCVPNSVYVYVTTGTLILIGLYKKVDLLQTKVNGTIDRGFMRMKLSYDLGKNGYHRPNSLGNR